MARALSCALFVLVLACGQEAPPSTIVPQIDRTPGERPAGTVIEVSIDGGDEALAALVAQLPPIPIRAGLPTRVSVLLDGLIDLPSEIREHVDGRSPVRLVLARVDGLVRSAIAVRLDAPLQTHPGGGPRGSDRVGDLAAVDDRIAVVSDDASLLEAAFPYLAYDALARPSDAGVVVIRVPATTLGTTFRSAIAQAIDDQRARALASIRQAREQHGPPDLGDPESLVSALADASLARIAYLPDLGDATIRLEATRSGLALTMTSRVPEESPLATALATHVPVSRAIVAMMPTASLVAIATGTRGEERATSQTDLVTTLGAIAGARMRGPERAGLTQAADAISAIRGDEGVIALGVEDGSGPFVVTVTRGGGDASAPTPWGRAFPWTTQLLGASFLCTPSTPRVTPDGTTLCGDVALATRNESGLRVDAIGHDAAAMITTLAHEGTTASPDLARDLAALPASTFATILVRPLRLLPVMSLFGGPTAGLPRGDGAFVLALAYDVNQLTITLRASGAAMADLATVQHLFANETDSE